MKKICVVTACRSEYGLLRWMMEEIKNSSKLKLQVLVTGAHLSPEFGNTYTEIEKDGFTIDEKVEMLLSADTTSAKVKSMGLCSIGIADSLDRLKPDCLVVLGDRYELLPICSAALVMRIPIAHISGGDVTEGAIDNEVRNAITQMSQIHFAGTSSSRNNIIRMIGTDKNVYCVGEINLDNFSRLPVLDRANIAKNLGLDSNKEWLLVTIHPETKQGLDKNCEMVENLLSVLESFTDYQLVMTYANADFGGSLINSRLEKFAQIYKDRCFLKKSLGQIYYINLLRHASCMIGNSSSGIYESKIVNLPVVNIGERQSGRPRTDNIIDCDISQESIRIAINRALSKEFKKTLTDNTDYYGDGTASCQIARILQELDL